MPQTHKDLNNDYTANHDENVNDLANTFLSEL